MNKVKFDLKYSSTTPLYRQIVEQIKKEIAIGRILPGERLPTVRKVAHSYNLNPGTVARAYAELERGGIVHTKKGGGSFAASDSDKKLGPFSDTHLSAILNQSIREGLSLGYCPEELETFFLLYLNKWREERGKRQLTEAPCPLKDKKSIIFIGSHDIALELLSSYLRRRSPNLSSHTNYAASYVGSLKGLIALEQKQAHISGIHLLDKETGGHNIPYVRRILPGQKTVLVNLAYRMQGLMFVRGNPKGIYGLSALRQKEITFVNRQRGSGTRVLLDYKLRQAGIAAEEIKGYGYEVATHLAAASAIADGTADVGLGISAAAQAFGLDFLPLSEERYDLVIPSGYYESDLIAPLLGVVNSSRFKKAMALLGGYRTDYTGEIKIVE
ncbi:GntR family transcriptional regulator [Thermodesulfovibrionales bacterium]|nr:GntR family transcriptional regulator [Thermodesulfovibrionales bacterium]